MVTETLEEQLMAELSELHDGSLCLLLTLPVFERMVTCEASSAELRDLHAAMGTHLTELDQTLGWARFGRVRDDSDLTKRLFTAVTELYAEPASPDRDRAVLRAVQHAQLYLLGSCGFAIRCARQIDRGAISEVLERSVRLLRSVGFPSVFSSRDELQMFEQLAAVA
jgi:hypothetical protein